ncbi:MAG TPA: NRDE family protein [Salinimicrobium sp.]|nr:NRDE family protein [Salinimicrobium sp.]
MCTVTLVPIKSEKNAFILTSSRDEAVARETSAPDFHVFNSKKMLYPKDALAGGTWIGVNENHRVVNLLNGGFKPHKREKSYKMSRGILVKEFLAADDIKEFIDGYDFFGIEPFTVIIVDVEEKLCFYELVWDGKKKYFQQLDLKSHIWSSSPLYSNNIKKQREELFFEFQKNKEINSENLWQLHHKTASGNPEVDFIIDRGFLKTKSITQIVKTSKHVKMLYQDLKKNEIVNKIFR